jgi:alkanesulfonate monooxygenase SsuD/methylene tetrahydromethanopterin reductase-like flavin-dependent oxidoreductase (luciferase family)
MLRVIARHADEWNMPSREGPQEWGEASSRLTKACAEVGRDPAAVRRSVQLFLHPRDPQQVTGQLDLLSQYQELGCEHAVLSFYQPPPVELLERCAQLR